VPFEINSETGEILSKGELDRETKEQYKFNVIAIDSSPIFQRTSETEVTITLRDQNDNFPKFKNPSYSVKVADDVSSGSYILGVYATDADSGLNGRVRYYLGGPDADKFQISDGTGVIKAIPALLKSSKTNFNLEVRAVDSSPKEPLSSSVTVKVELLSADRFPKVKSDSQEFSFSENVSNAVVTTLVGTPAKSGDRRPRRFNYFIGGGNLGNAFTVDNNSGKLSVSPSGLDFETAKEYELWVEVSEQDEPELRSAVPIYIKVKDVNDNSPIFETKIYNVSIPEEEPGPKLVTTVVAVDKDSGVNGEIRYMLSEETVKKYGKLFEIKRESGEVYSMFKLDREEQSHYVLEVEASDLGDPPKTGTATVMINVLDINDNPMKFTRLFSVNVTENAPVGTFVIQVTSVDKDIGENANCSYSFTDNASGKFVIDPYSGNVTVSGILDREAQDEYLLKVSAVDGSWRAETLLTVTLEDVNDMSPEFESSSYDFNIPESEHPVSFVGQVTAIDRDKRGPNSLVTYSLKQQSDLFSIDPVSGEIFTKKALKYKNSLRRFSPENENSLVITAVDSGKPPMSSECAITINVVNANNHAPEFQKKSYFSPVLFNMTLGTKIVQVTASDANDFGVNSELEYLSIGGNGSELFTIQKETGWIVLSGDVNDKVSNSYTLQIRAVDKGIPPLSDDTTVVIVVTGPNYHSPVFSSLSYRVIVPENQAIETAIVSVNATDQDSGPNGQVVYNISKGNADARFSIDISSGAVLINKGLDYDTKKEYRLSITATDLGYESRSSEAELTVILTDVNDNPPYFENSLHLAYIKENAPINSPVFRLTAKDKDSPKNGIIRYAIVGGSGKHAFALDTSTGLISSSKIFDYEDRSEYMLDVLASNPDTNLHGTTKVQILVQGVNEYVPKFVEPVFHFTVSESAAIGSQIGSVQATDEDSGEDGTVYYLLVGSSNDRGFLINTNTGAITISRRLDRESQSRVVLTVLAKNSGSIKGNDTDEAQIVINIQDGNDPPVFEKETYRAEVSEDVPVGSLVVSVKANDIDVRPSNNRFTYEILDGNVNKTFKIDPITGYISTAEFLDRESVAAYTLVIGAVDTGQPPQTGTTLVKINILDVNDSPPILKSSSIEGRILENEPPNTRVMTLKATDSDISPNAEPFQFNLVGGKDASKFKVDPKNGNVFSTVSFDRESTPELQILVEISDSGTPSLKSRQEVKILVQDKNDSPSQPRNGSLLVYLFKNNLPRSKIASIEPLDRDEIGQYTCRLESGQDLFKISSNCDLQLTKIPSGRRQMLPVTADDGRHAEVKSFMQTEFNFIDNSTVRSSVVIRAVGARSSKLLGTSYTKLASYLKSVFNMEPQIYGFISQENGTDIILAINSGGEYLGVEEVTSVLVTHKGKIESILETSIIINYSICTSQNACHNGASCKQSLNSYPTQSIVNSPLLILSAPTVQLEFSCQCPSSFTGKLMTYDDKLLIYFLYRKQLHLMRLNFSVSKLGSNCQLRKEPCQPNPCESGGTCIKQGFNFTCICPPQRQGKLCEVERSSACESNPCQNGGSCQDNQQAGTYFCLCRPGFYGNLCQTASNACKPNPCLNGGECFNPAGSSAFPRCKCRTHYYGRYCEKSAFGFSIGSFMSFPPLDPNTNDIAVVFSTNKKNALLVYDFGEQTGGRSDFVALQLINGKASFSYGGARTAVSSIMVNKVVSDGQWYRIIATRNSRVVSLTVSACKDSGEICDDCRPGDPSCYANDIGISG
jgi:protocadherin Fat 4